MPRPVGPGPEEAGAYVPGLDGIRALAVVAVLAYHLELPWMQGGLLGVGMFFTLSGFLITRILLTSRERTGSFHLRRFWVHRARRLLPAVVLVLTTVLLGTAVADRDALGRRWGETWSALAYVANWHTIAQGQSYFDRFAGPGPLDHLWSLSVEEQFYLVWPLLLVGMYAARLTRAQVVTTTAAMAAASFALLSLLAHPGFDNTRAYEGTDTRAGGILVGALLALAWPRLVDLAAARPAVHRGVQAAGAVGLGACAWLVVSTDDYWLGLYHSGLLVLSLATVALVAAVALPGSGPGSGLGVVLGVAPLRWVGERSYGIYLWQLPVAAAVGTAALAQHRVWTSLLVTGLTLALAEVSWRFVEDPVRRLGFVGAGRRIHEIVIPHRSGHRTVRVPLLPVAAACLVLLGTGTLVSCQRDAPAQDQEALLATGMPPIPDDVGSQAPVRHHTARPQGTSSSRPSADAPSGPSSHQQGGGPTTGPDREPAQTSCQAVAHIGESTSIGLVDPAYLPDPAKRLPAQLRRHGVQEIRTDILGARSIVERWHDQPNAQEAAQSLRTDGYHGCWTVAMGTNEAANQAVGGVYPFAERIDLLMKAIGDAPVLWLTVKSRLGSGPYDDAHMQAFDDALLAACDRYPKLRVYDWRSEVRDEWFVPDGIHFTSTGYAARAARIADALTRAFPAAGPSSPDCVVRSGRR